MEGNTTVLSIVALLCAVSVAKAYFNSKSRHFVVTEIDRLRERIEALERRGP